jgi:drug/metabolite transporter (DMT)-like permease
MGKSTQRTALACVATGTLGQAAGSVVLGHGVEPGGAVANTLIAFVAAAAISVAVLGPRGARRLAALLTSVTAARRWSLLLLAATSAVFGGFYLAITMIDAVAVSSLEAGIGPFLALFLFLFPVRGGSLRRAAAPSIVLLLSVVVVLLVLGRAGAQPSSAAAIGLAVTAVVGVAGVVIVLASQRLRAHGLTATDINVVRFVGSSVLFALVAGPVLLVGGPPVGVRPIVAVFLIALPFLVLQIGIVHGDPLRNELAMSSLPALVYVGSSLRESTWSLALGGRDARRARRRDHRGPRRRLTPHRPLPRNVTPCPSDAGLRPPDHPEKDASFATG